MYPSPHLDKYPSPFMHPYNPLASKPFDHRDLMFQTPGYVGYPKTGMGVSNNSGDTMEGMQMGEGMRGKNMSVHLTNYKESPS